MIEKPRIKKINLSITDESVYTYWYCSDSRFHGFGSSITEAFNKYEKIKNAHLKHIEWVGKQMDIIYGE